MLLEVDHTLVLCANMGLSCAVMCCCALTVSAGAHRSVVVLEKAGEAHRLQCSRGEEEEAEEEEEAANSARGANSPHLTCHSFCPFPLYVALDKSVC